MAAVDLMLPKTGASQDTAPFSESTAEDDLTRRGRALAHQAVEEMIAEIQLRASRHLLDRGLRISLPYFDDRRLSLRYWAFTVTPKGRIMFVPSFVVLAVEREIERVTVARELTPTTRTHLLDGLRGLGNAFRTDPYANLKSDIPLR
jgi:hypothetical protein